MANVPKGQSWWQTLPGVLTATAGIITAVTGLIVVLYQAGFFQPATKENNPTTTGPSASETSIANSPATEPSNQPAAGGTEDGSSLPKTQKVSGLPRRINLFAPENGVQLLIASANSWSAAIDGKEELIYINDGPGNEAVFAFKDERPATFDTFTILIEETNNFNIKEFELLTSNESPTGTFDSLGKFQTENVKLFKTPFQEFKFPPVAAKYLKIKLLNTHGGNSAVGIREFQLYGSLNR